MTTPDSKTEPARRTYASLVACRGFRWHQGGQRGTGVVVSIAVMGGRTYWRHIGSGAWSAKDALYEEVGQ